MTKPADDWTQRKLQALATKYFPGRHRELEGVVRGLMGRHEEEWRTQPPGTYRPTGPMYALALEWELERQGATCSVCRGKVALPTPPSPPSAVGSGFMLALRKRAADGGLNVPQNLALCHADCMPGF